MPKQFKGIHGGKKSEAEVRLIVEQRIEKQRQARENMPGLRADPIEDSLYEWPYIFAVCDENQRLKGFHYGYAPMDGIASAREYGPIFLVSYLNRKTGEWIDMRGAELPPRNGSVMGGIFIPDDAKCPANLPASVI